MIGAVFWRASDGDAVVITTAPTALFMGMGSQNVNTVLIAGKVMKRNGQLLDVDLDRLARHDARDRPLCERQCQEHAHLKARARRAAACRSGTESLDELPSDRRIRLGGTRIQRCLECAIEHAVRASASGCQQDAQGALPGQS
jgi:hypothetical protein